MKKGERKDDNRTLKEMKGEYENSEAVKEDCDWGMRGGFEK